MEFINKRFVSGEILKKKHLCEHYEDNDYVNLILKDFWSIQILLKNQKYDDVVEYLEDIYIRE